MPMNDDDDCFDIMRFSFRCFFTDVDCDAEHFSFIHVLSNDMNE